MENGRKTLVILPGWSGSRESWKKFTDLADKKFQVICLNLPCFGDEPCPSEVWGVEEYADFVSAKLKALGVERPLLLGHSFGGQIAVKLAANGHLAVSGLILCAPPVYRPANLIRRVIFYILAKLGKIFFLIPLTKEWCTPVKNLFHRIIGAHDYEKTNGINRAIFKKVIREDVSHLLASIHVPTLVVWGTRDGYVSVRYAKKIASAIPNAKLSLFSGGNHGLHLQQPEALLDQIDTFARSLSL